MDANKNCCCCKGNVENQCGQQGQAGGQQQEQQSQAGVCKKELALMQILAEQMKPPPLQVSFKVGVPKRKEACELENDPPCPKNTTNRPNKFPAASDDTKRTNGKCPLMEENLKAINERKTNNSNPK